MSKRDMKNLINSRPTGRRGLWSLVLLFLLAGCLPSRQPSLRIDYYTLDYPPPPIKMAKTAPLPVILSVQRFTVTPIYETDKLIYKDKNYSRAAYSYHRWQANPADLVTYYLTRDLQAGHLFAAVLPAMSNMSPTNMLEGTVDDFMEDDEGGNWYAVLAVTVILKRNHELDVSKEVIFQKSFSYRIKCREKQPLAVARAMSQAMAKLSADLNSSIYQALKDNNAEHNQ